MLNHKIHVRYFIFQEGFLKRTRADISQTCSYFQPRNTYSATHTQSSKHLTFPSTKKNISHEYIRYFLFVLYYCIYLVLCGITNNIIGSLCPCTIQLICIMLLNACTQYVHLCYRKLGKILVNKEIFMLFFIRVLLDFKKRS